MALKCEVVLNEWWTDITSTVLCKTRPQHNTNIQYSESAAKKQSSNTVDSIAPCLSKHVIRVYISGAWSAKRFKHLNGVVRSLCKSQVHSFQPEYLCWLFVNSITLQTIHTIKHALKAHLTFNCSRSWWFIFCNSTTQMVVYGNLNTA